MPVSDLVNYGAWARLNLSRRTLWRACPHRPPTVLDMQQRDGEILVSAVELSLLLGTSYKTIKRLAAQQRWYADELPAPLDDMSPRRWSVTELDHWLMEAELRN